MMGCEPSQFTDLIWSIFYIYNVERAVYVATLWPPLLLFGLLVNGRQDKQRRG